MDREKQARDLFEDVKTNNISSIKQRLNSGLTPDVIKYELFIPNLLEHSLQENKLAFKLLQCEINSLSSFHLAAMLGYMDILIEFLDKRVTAEAVLESGTTALHLASFGGRMATTRLLLNVYKSEVNKADRYGWTALHYASTEGHLDIIKMLVQFGADINKRDKDGTCAALRAQWQGHEEVVSYYCHMGEEDELLNIVENPESPSPILKEPPYATVQKKKEREKSRKGEGHIAERSASFSVEQSERLVPQTEPVDTSPGAQGPVVRRHSEVASKPGLSNSNTKFSTLPPKFKEARNSRIRRVIRKELEAAFSDYANPQDVVGASGAEESEILMAGVGVQTMTKLMREEIMKYKTQMMSPQFSAGPAIKEETHGVHGDEDEEYESLYDTIKGFGEAPAPPSGPQKGIHDTYVPPPLPPRNPDDVTSRHDIEEPEDEVDKMMKSMTIKGQPTSEALNAAIRKLAQIVGRDWKKLARALPLDPNPSKVEERIKAIEKEHLGNSEKQALQALLDWRLKMGRHAEVDRLILAMRKCGLHDRIEEMEQAALEFTA